jgi:hypothetical protein
MSLRASSATADIVVGTQFHNKSDEKIDFGKIAEAIRMLTSNQVFANHSLEHLSKAVNIEHGTRAIAKSNSIASMVDVKDPVNGPASSPNGRGGPSTPVIS